VAEEVLWLIAGGTAFFLALYSILAVHETKKTMRTLQRTLQKLERQLDDVSRETKQFLQNAGECAADARQHMQSMRALFRSIDLFGRAAEQLAFSIKQMSENISSTIAADGRDTADSRTEQTAGLLELAAMSVGIWQKGMRMVRHVKAGNLEKNHKGEDHHE
jgi:uncharacterized protein YoxC